MEGPEKRKMFSCEMISCGILEGEENFEIKISVAVHGNCFVVMVTMDLNASPCRTCWFLKAQSKVIPNCRISSYIKEGERCRSDVISLYTYGWSRFRVHTGLTRGGGVGKDKQQTRALYHLRGRQKYAINNIIFWFHKYASGKEIGCVNGARWCLTSSVPGDRPDPCRLCVKKLL